MNPLTNQESKRIERPVEARGGLALSELKSDSNSATASGSSVPSRNPKRNWQMIEDPASESVRSDRWPADQYDATRKDILFDGVSDWPEVLQAWSEQYKENNMDARGLWNVPPVKMKVALATARHAETRATPFDICIDSDCENELSHIGCPPTLPVSGGVTAPASDANPVLSVHLLSANGSGLKAPGACDQHTFCADELRARVWYQSRS